MSEDHGERPARRTKLDEAWTLRAANLALGPNLTDSTVLRRHDAGTGKLLEVVAVLIMTGASSGRLLFTYPVGPGIDLVTTQQPLGGLRWWFLCPDGHGRCSTIIKPAGKSRFASRKAWGPVSYRSQRSTPLRRAEARAKAIRLALRGSPDLDTPFPPKPPQMRRATYERRRAEAEAAASIARASRRVPATEDSPTPSP